MQIDVEKEQLHALLQQLGSENATLKLVNAEYLADLKVTKDSIAALLLKIGLVDKNGTFKDNIDFSSLLGTITKVMWMSEEKKKQEFSFLAALVPVFEKYKNL